MQTRSHSRAKNDRMYYINEVGKKAKRKPLKYKAANSGLKIHRFSERLVTALNKVEEKDRDRELEQLKMMFRNCKECKMVDEYSFCIRYTHHVEAESTTIEPQLENPRMIKTVFQIDGIDYVSTQKSNIDNAGIGLFAEKRFHKDEIIGVYFGEYIADIVNGSESRYQFLHMDVPILGNGAQERYFGRQGE